MMKLTEKQKDIAREVVDVDSFVIKDDLEGLEEALTVYVLDSMDSDGEPTDLGRKIEQLRDDIFAYNEYEDYKPRFV